MIATFPPASSTLISITAARGNLSRTVFTAACNACRSSAASTVPTTTTSVAVMAQSASDRAWLTA